MKPPGPALVRRHFLLLTIAWALFIIYGSLVPLATRTLSIGLAVETFVQRMSTGVEFASLSDWTANILLFVPLGFVLAGTVGVDRRTTAGLFVTIPAMTAFSAAVEFLQLWFPDRTTSVNDVAAETLGGIAGVLVWLMFGQAATNRFRQAWSGLGPGDWAAKALPAYVFFLVFLHGMPFDMTISPGSLWHKYKSGLEIDAKPDGPYISIAPHQSQIAKKTLMNIVFFVPIGALLARFPSRRWQDRQSAIGVFGVGLAIGALVEFVQLFVLSAGTYATDVLTCGVFCWAGWRLSLDPRPWPLWVRPVCLVAWTTLVILVEWWPFSFEPLTKPFIDRVEWLPFADYYAGDYIRAFNSILNKTTLYVPLGYFAFRLGSRTSVRPILAGTGISVLIEAGQAVMASHPSSVSDVILGGIGGLIGGFAARRVTGERAGDS